MIAISLQSGSNGNCIYVETSDCRLLFDAGISGIQAERRLVAHGRDIRRADAVIISHEHRDHICSAGIFNRKYGLPVYVTSKALGASQGRMALGRMSDVRYFRTGDALLFDGIRVETVQTAHDSADGAAFVIEAQGKRLGLLTDLGHPFEGLAEIVGSLDAVIIESNYDQQMLETGPYPQQLKRRIAGPGGHLSNVEAARLLGRSQSRLHWACLAHLSETNNTKERALATHREILGNGLELFVASRYEVSGIMTV